MLIVNSFASSVTARNTVVVHRRLSEGDTIGRPRPGDESTSLADPDVPRRRSRRQHDVEIVETNRRGHATRFAHDAARRGFDVVIGYGGDGTLNEVATGIAGSDTALGVLPGGSTNVFARTLGMPNDPVLAVEHLVAGIEANDIRPIGLGQVNGRYFCFHTGVGYDAAVVQAVERRGALKRWLGHPLFISAGLSTWLTGYDRKQPHFTISGGDQPDEPNGFFTIVLNTNPYTYLGNRPLDLSPEAGLDRDGLVAITFTTMRASAILRSLAGALRGGGVAAAEHLDIRTELSELVIHHPDPFPYQLDGDALGETPRLEFQHVPDAVKLVFPTTPN
ncbi:MAG: diacylglycerol/lipid kinase family protein [Ilumatobacter sp.]|jgi:diacylglycerol kinase family enzyme|uniref:diacylglycerol/lipid kinase family protein n=1 Tax=Ilumatobacter sp. TaxID=1967498 RepID=UPI00391AD148